MKKVLILVGLLALHLTMFAQADTQADSLKNVQLEEVVVSATRAGQRTPMAYSNVSAVELKKENAANNLPMVLQTLPSVVAFTEGGTGVGNTAFRIRGTDATRINVTLNGMPLNNPESSEVYWVNLPDLSNSLQSVQLQRGVGTSTNGGSAFGASLSLQTAGGRSQAYGEASTAVGSYNTFSSTIAAGTGILSNGLSFDARYSYIRSDGYIRNGFVNHNNLYAALSHYSDRQLLRLVYLRGRQKTGITWEGVTADEIEKYGRRYNPTGKYKDDAGNTLYYHDDSDNYYSDIAQMIFTRNLTDYLDMNANLSYNYGYGYYENYKTDQNLKSKFGFDPQVIDGVTYTKSDVVRRKLMENHFYVANVGLTYHRNAWHIQGGAMYSFYDGDHFGYLPWVKYNQNIAPDAKWYDNNGKKSEINLFMKAEYQINEKLSVFGDVQGRFLTYKFTGTDDDFVDLTDDFKYNFFNPKAGAFYNFNPWNRIYGSVSVGNREPLRADLKDAKKGNVPHEVKPERMYDFELGYKFDRNSYRLGANLYYMLYDNQLVQTGRLSDIGYKLMENVKNSYRAGIELEAGIPIVPGKLRLDANATISTNKIKNYTAYYDVYDENWDVVDQKTEEFASTDISYSPNLVSAISLAYTPTSAWRFALLGKYVGKQYLDNTSSDSRSLDAYFVSNLTAGYTFRPTNLGIISLDFYVNNIFGTEYSANGYASQSFFREGSTDTAADYVGYYPQATRNFMARLTVSF